MEPLHVHVSPATVDRPPHISILFHYSQDTATIRALLGAVKHVDQRHTGQVYTTVNDEEDAVLFVMAKRNITERHLKEFAESMATHLQTTVEWCEAERVYLIPVFVERLGGNPNLN